MRSRILTASLLLLLPFLMTANHIEGRFTSIDHHVRVKIKDYRHGIKIKGLVTRNYVKFRYVRPNTYSDYYGNMVKIVGPHKIVFRSNNWTDKISLYRNGYEPKVKYRKRKLNRFEGTFYGDKNNDNTYGRNEYGESYKRLSQLEGTWESNKPNKEIVILETRNGIKVKFVGEKKWTRFDNVSYDNRILKDKKGNEYSIISPDKLEWRDRHGDRTISLRKISDEVRY